MGRSGGVEEGEIGRRRRVVVEKREGLEGLMDRIVRWLGVKGVASALAALVLAYLLRNRTTFARRVLAKIMYVVKAFLLMVGGDTLFDGRRWLG